MSNIFKKQYRLVDKIDSKNELNAIIVESSGFFDKILFNTWWHEKSFPYDYEQQNYMHRTRDEAIALAKQWIDDVKSNKRNISNVVLEVC